MVWIAVASGGALGAMARHAVNKWVHHGWPFARFPLATLVVNVSGCFTVGVLAGLIATGRLPMRANWREFVFVGLLGGFTTFSTFGLDTMTLLRGGEAGQALANVALHIIGGLGAVYVGFLVVERLG